MVLSIHNRPCIKLTTLTLFSLVPCTSAFLRELTVNTRHEKEGPPTILGLPRCKNLTRFSLFVSFCFAVRCCLKCFCFLCFTSSVSFTGSYTEVKPQFWWPSWIQEFGYVIARQPIRHFSPVNPDPGSVFR